MNTLVFYIEALDIFCKLTLTSNLKASFDDKTYK